MIVFETSRVLVRQFAMTDVEDFFHLNSDAEVMKYIRNPLTWDDSYHFLEKNIDIYRENSGYGRWAVFEKGELHFMGSFMIRPSDSIPGEIELGYALLKPFWGKGYASELLRSGLTYAFSKLQLITVSAITHPENEPSKKVLLKNGFHSMPDLTLENRAVNFFTIHNPLAVETDRLLIYPLSASQLALYLEAGDLFEKKWQLAQNGRTVAPQVKTMVTLMTLPKIKRSSKDEYLFHTFWLILEKKSKVIIAELGFKGTPNRNGSIEIGYGTFEGKRGLGYMTEAVGGMVKWAKARNDIRYILAETDAQNFASIRVVEKNKFTQFDKIGKMCWWKIDLRD